MWGPYKSALVAAPGGYCGVLRRVNCKIGKIYRRDENISKMDVDGCRQRRRASTSSVSLQY